MSWTRAITLFGCGIGLIAGLLALTLPQHAMALALVAALGAGLGMSATLVAPRGDVEGEGATPFASARAGTEASGSQAEAVDLRAELEKHRALEQELIRAKQEAEAATMAKGEFLATMSHEIRTPLNGVIPLLELVLSTDLTHDQRDYLDTAYGSARELLRIVDDILDYSKLDAQKLQLENVGVNLRELAVGVLRLMEKSAEAKGLRLGLALDPKVRLAVRGDPVRLRQVLTNLVSNAIKFTDRGSVSLHITQPSSTRTRNKLRFEVRDTGIGIAPEAAAHLFQAFSQADASTTRTFGGTGLGLAICKRIITLMGGDIGVDSVPGKGSTFWFEVALDKALGDIEGRAPDAEQARVLLISANARQQRRLGTMIQQWGMQLTQAANTQEAIARLRSLRARPDLRDFDLVLVDVASIPATVLALHRSLARETRPGQTARIYLRGDESLPQELEASADFHVLARDGDEASLRVAITRLLEAREDLEEAPQGAEDASVDAASAPEEAAQTLDAGSPQKPAADTGSSPLTAHESETVAEVGLPVTGVGAPRKPAPRPVTAVAPATPPTEQSGRVLLVEDNPVNRQVAQRLLSLAGIAFDSAENGKEALDKMNAGGYDAVLMDCQMPIMDGYTATRQRRQHEKAHRMTRLPIIAMTANAMLGDREKCLDAGMDDYLTKPLNRALLESRLRHWIATVAPAAQGGAATNAAPPAPAPMPLPGPVVAASPRVIPRDASSQASAQPPVDREILQELRDVMGAEFDSLVQVFLNDAPDVIGRIRKFADEGTHAALAAPAHTLKSTSANLGAMVLSAMARGIEQDARQGLVVDAVNRATALEAEFERVAVALRGETARAG